MGNIGSFRRHVNIASGCWRHQVRDHTIAWPALQD